MKAIFTPFSIVLGLIAGQLGKRLFEKLWAVIDDEEPPDSKHREGTWTKMIVSAALQGAIFRVVKSLVDRGARTGVLNLTGTWPGQEQLDRKP